MAAVSTDNLKLSDGTTMDLARVPDVDDATWDEVKQYLEGNPDMARNLQKFAKDPEAVRGWMQTQVMAKHYQEKLETDTKLQEHMKSLEHDAEFSAMFEDIKKNGLEAIMKYHQDEELMLKFSKKMGGLPSELAPQLKKLDETPLNFHEACKLGDLKSVQACIDKKQALDTQDHKGITPLGYAIGANRIAVVKLLLDKRANPYAVDSSGNSGLHYAAGYGKKELLEYLLKVGVSPAQANSQGQKPIDVATINRHTVVMEILNKA